MEFMEPITELARGIESLAKESYYDLMASNFEGYYKCLAELEEKAKQLHSQAILLNSTTNLGVKMVTQIEAKELTKDQLCDIVKS